MFSNKYLMLKTLLKLLLMGVRVEGSVAVGRESELAFLKLLLCARHFICRLCLMLRAAWRAIPVLSIFQILNGKKAGGDRDLFQVV